MNDVLRARLLRHIEALPEAQVYQALDFIEFLSSKYARDQVRAASSVQRFGEILEDKMRVQGVAMGAIKGTMGVLSTADRVFSGLSEAGKSLIKTVEQGMTSAADAVSSSTSSPSAEKPGPSEPPRLPPAGESGGGGA
jgi:hypothetical protein